MILKYKIFIIFFYLALISQSLSSDQKIVYLNLDYLVQNSAPGKLILQELDSIKKKNIEQFKLKKNKLKNKEDDLIKKKNILSTEEFESEVLALRGEMNNYNKDRQEIFSKFEENKKKKLNEFLKKITPLIETFVKENSINIVLNEKNLFIASKKFDITNQIIEIVNKNY
tara:strand:- start:285 stop:794 length:510 start_codon:yes stop_codon:yes gene_type:complete